MAGGSASRVLGGRRSISWQTRKSKKERRTGCEQAVSVKRIAAGLSTLLSFDMAGDMCVAHYGEEGSYIWRTEFIQSRI